MQNHHHHRCYGDSFCEVRMLFFHIEMHPGGLPTQVVTPGYRCDLPSTCYLLGYQVISPEIKKMLRFIIL